MYLYITRRPLAHCPAVLPLTALTYAIEAEPRDDCRLIPVAKYVCDTWPVKGHSIALGTQCCIAGECRMCHSQAKVNKVGASHLHQLHAAAHGCQGATDTLKTDSSSQECLSHAWPVITLGTHCCIAGEYRLCATVRPK